MDPLVTIVMPAYNAERHIGEAIRSVLAQTWVNWELLIVDDGSSDATAAEVLRFQDPRIVLLRRPNGGVSAARNQALDRARGAFLCFLDADDVLPPESLQARLAVLQQHPGTDIADGRVLLMDDRLERTLRTYVPSFTGEPFLELVHLTGSCFCGNTWMLRWSAEEQARFDPALTHGEDLLFYLEYAPGRIYRATEATVLHYRRSAGSSMSDLRGLERSYHHILAWLDRHADRVPRADRALFRRRVRRIMVGSYWHAREPLRALAALLRRP